MTQELVDGRLFDRESATVLYHFRRMHDEKEHDYSFSPACEQDVTYFRTPAGTLVRSAVFAWQPPKSWIRRLRFGSQPETTIETEPLEKLDAVKRLIADTRMTATEAIKTLGVEIEQL